MAGETRPITVLHAFSRHNAGDGLLVDLTLDALAAAGVKRDRIEVLALDPESFPELDKVHRAPGEPTARPTIKLAKAAGTLAASLVGADNLRDRLKKSHALVAVGGGYLVADSPTRQAGVLLNHLAQLRAAASHPGPTIYLPQSIGPLHGVAKALALPALAKIDRIWVRDDETERELGLSNTCRCPDLAVMELAERFSGIEAAASDGRPVLVGRDLPRAGDYAQRLGKLSNSLGDVSWAVQADVAGPRSDRAFYHRQGWKDAGSLAQVLQEPTGPVVSVRLHGAIAALLAGRPTIHLAYERKGWGAYEDLGLERWVHDARDFDPELVAAQVRDLSQDAGPFWQAVAQSCDKIRASKQEMIADLAARLGE